MIFGADKSDTAVECVGADGRNGVRDRDASQGRAVEECVASDGNKSVRKSNSLK